MRLGKHPKKTDRRTLMMARYMPRLPIPLIRVDHATKLPADIGMMGNDVYGDCTFAAAGHAIQSWSTYAGTIDTIPDADLLAAYKVLSPNDNGAFMLDVLNYWNKTGIGGDHIEAFIETGTADLTQAKLAIEYFGSTYIGMSLPDTNTEGPWDVVNPTWPANPNNGHCVVLIGYDDSLKMFKVCTWGLVVDMSYGWFQKYTDESYAILNDIELIKATGKSPEGFDLAALTSDLAHIGDPIVDPGPTPPVPVPVPVPPVPGPQPGPTPIPGITGPITITATTSLNWVVSLNGVATKPAHGRLEEALQHADVLRWKNPKAKIEVKHAATYKVS
jgi:hypothetical protein